jgi:endo-1,4-beta-xylanase
VFLSGSPSALQLSYSQALLLQKKEPTSHTMVQLTNVALVALSAIGAVAAPAEKRQQGTPSSTGQHGGYYYSWWTDGASPVTYENLDGGGYRVNWQSGGNFVGGKGWNPGNAQRYVLADNRNRNQTLRYNC